MYQRIEWRRLAMHISLYSGRITLCLSGLGVLVWLGLVIKDGFVLVASCGVEIMKYADIKRAVS